MYMYICTYLMYIHVSHENACRFEFVSVPLVHPRYKREFFRILPERPGPLTRSDKVLSGSSWSTLIVAKLSPWIDLDSSDETVKKNSEKVRLHPMHASVKQGYNIMYMYVHVVLSLCLLPDWDGCVHVCLVRVHNYY